MSNLVHESPLCLICIDKCPLAGIRYSWSLMKDYFDGTMEHFHLSRGRPYTIVNGRRIYLKKGIIIQNLTKKVFGVKMQITILGEFVTMATVRGLSYIK